MSPKKNLRKNKLTSNTFQWKPKPEKKTKPKWNFTQLFKSSKKSVQFRKPQVNIKQKERNEKVNPAENQKKSQRSSAILVNLLKFLGYLLSLPFLLVFLPIKAIFNSVVKVFTVRENLIKLSFLALFLLVSFRFAQLQIFTENSAFGLGQAIQVNSKAFLVPARRGQIYIQDKSQNKTDVALTSSQIQYNIFFDAKNLNSLVAKDLDVENAALEIASRVNLPYNDVLNKLTVQVQENSSNQSVILAQNITLQQKQSVEFLRSSSLNKQFNFQLWLGITEKQTRSYLENKLLAPTLGYVPPFSQANSEIESRFRSCLPMVENNIRRQTDTGQYLVGSYGLEQKYCSELGGLNGKRLVSKNQGENTDVQNGADLYLTIDVNIQREAERILENTVKATTNENGSPKNGAIIVMEVQTGKILGLASYPYYDPNDYQKYWQENPLAFRNAATNIDYDIGSVMKPLTVAAALNTYQSGVVQDGKLKGVAADFRFKDYDTKGKIYEELNGRQLFIQNAEGRTYQQYGNLGLKEIIRDSINTGIADVVDATGAVQLKSYYTERFKLGQSTAISLPGDEHGNVRNFTTDIRCAFCYANFGFGQGFTASPIQLARAYTAIANKGQLVEPYLVEKIKYQDGFIDDGSTPESSIRREPAQQVLTQTTANLVTSYMRATVEDGFLGSEPSVARVPGWEVAGKTGTAEVNRPYVVTDNFGKPKLDEKGNPVLQPCDYSCNRARGIYDHTFIGFAPAKDPKYLVLVKLSEPNPGRVKNFSSTTAGAPFSEMMSFTLNYMKVPKDY